MTQIRVGIICDFREEGWHSMDLIGDMLLNKLPSASEGSITASRLRPAMARRFGRIPIVGRSSRARLADRITGRFFDYPRWLKSRVKDFDVFHIVDHSYAHLVQALPANRTIVTCNDTDAIAAVLTGNSGTLSPSRMLATRILEGLAAAARVACISEATREELLAAGRISPGRVSVSYLGVHPTCSPAPDAQWDDALNQRLGAKPQLDLLHVGSTIPRKRIEHLLEIFRGVSEQRPEARLIRVGDPFTRAQQARAEQLGIADRIVQLPFLERAELAAVYRRAALVLLPSVREGFGLPVVEAMACGTPVLASEIPSLAEVGGDAVMLCKPEDTACWVETTLKYLRERDAQSEAWRARRNRCLGCVRRFDWLIYAQAMTRLYQSVAASA